LFSGFTSGIDVLAASITICPGLDWWWLFCCACFGFWWFLTATWLPELPLRTGKEPCVILFTYYVVLFSGEFAWICP